MKPPQLSLVLVRDVTTAAIPVLPAGFSSLSVRATADEHFPLLQRSCEVDGIPARWTQRMLEQRREAHLLLSDVGEVVATAWIARGPYYISEIRRTFDPGPEGDYYFGDYVAPAFRGRKMHAVLIALRTSASRIAGRRWAIGMTDANNLPSILGYRSAGFEIAAQLRTRRIGRWRIDKITWRRPPLPLVHFSTEGLRLPILGRLRRS